MTIEISWNPNRVDPAFSFTLSLFAGMRHPASHRVRSELCREKLKRSYSSFYLSIYSSESYLSFRLLRAIKYLSGRKRVFYVIDGRWMSLLTFLTLHSADQIARPVIICISHHKPLSGWSLWSSIDLFKRDWLVKKKKRDIEASTRSLLKRLPRASMSFDWSPAALRRGMM